MKLGIGSYTYMWSIGFPGAEPDRPMSALDLLEQAVELGVKVVQYGPNLPLDRLSARALDELSRAAQSSGIDVEVGAKGLDCAHLRGQMELAGRVGSKLLRTVPDYEKRTAPPPVDELCRTLEPLLPHLGVARLPVAIENATIPAAVLSDALDLLSSPWLGITLDTVNSLAIPEGTEQVARTLARHTLSLHVKDFSVDRIWHMMGFTVEGRPAGAGQLDVPWLTGLLKAAGRDPNAILELWPPRQKTLEETIALERSWARESISYLRRIIPD